MKTAVGTEPPKPSEGQRGNVESDCLSTKADLFIHDKQDQDSYTHWFKRYQRDRAPINLTHSANSMLTCTQHNQGDFWEHNHNVLDNTV